MPDAQAPAAYRRVRATFGRYVACTCAAARLAAEKTLSDWHLVRPEARELLEWFME